MEKEVDKLKFPSYIIELGVISGDSKNKRKETYQFGVTNAELMFIHENGSPLNHIPSRPVLKLTYEWLTSEGKIELVKTMVKCVGLVMMERPIEEIDNEMDKLCLKIQNHARKIIYSNDGQLAPNAPSTIRKKGDNHPLFDTGQLARSITCRARRI